MKHLFVLIAIVAAASAEPAKHVLKFSKSESPRIISGSPAELGQFKYQVGFVLENAWGHWLCGGALLNSRWVLTAAHCVYGAKYFNMFMGGIYSDGRPESTKQKVYTTNGTSHPDYATGVANQNDIALINLNTEVAFTDTVQPISLSSEHIGGGHKLTVSGWGWTSDPSETMSAILNYAEVNSMTNDECKGHWQANIFEGSLCCTGSPEHSPCRGDSGGPLVKYDSNGVASHVGLVSYADPSGCSLGSPAVFVRTEIYISWINGVIGNEVV